MKFLKKNQVVLYVIALMLVVAAYLNYTPSGDLSSSLQASSDAEELSELANIGDARLVDSDDIIGEETIEINEQNSEQTLVENKDVQEPNNTDSNNEIVTNSIPKDSVLTSANSTTQSTKDDYFTSSKLERDTMYSQMLETYEKVLNSSNSLETQKQSATQEITKISETKNRIMICENLIKTKGFENNVIFVNGESISVVIGKVNGQELKQEEVAQIQNIIEREMGVQIENIHISSK